MDIVPKPSLHRNRILVVSFILLAAAIFLARTWPRAATPVSAEVLAQGRDLYLATCAACHGEQGEGHAALSAPALDHSEHAWHHPDWQISGLIRKGGGQMPPVGADWPDRDVGAVMAYIKTWWTPEQLEHQTKASVQPR